MESGRKFYLTLASVCTAIVLILALLPWPYGYYQFLRLIVAVSGAFLAASAYRSGERWLVVGLVSAVLIFNPLIPLHLEREQWAVLNLAGAALFVLAFVGIRRGRLD